MLHQEDVIHKFREMVAQRYDFAALSDRFELPEEISEQVISEISDYFLENIYPEAERRKALEEAFSELSVYIRSPRKIWGLLGSMPMALIRFGTQFPLALKTGLNALEAFVGAKSFESQMVAQSAKLHVGPDLSDDAFEQLMSCLNRREVERFIRDVKRLFQAMTNTVLIRKTLHILDDVVTIMRKKPHIYPPGDIDGILLGREILQQGHDLFTKYDTATRRLMVAYIYRNEMWFTDHVFSKWKP